MRWRSLGREVVATTWSAKVPTALVIVVVAAMCAAVIATVGRTAAAARDVAHQLEDAGARQLTVVDASASGVLNRSTLQQIQQLSTVERAVMVAAPFDGYNSATGAGGTKIPVWASVGEVTGLVELVSGRWPNQGEALISTTQQHTLGMSQGIGSLTSADGWRQYPIVGTYRSRVPFTDLDQGAVVAGAASTVGRELRLVIGSVTAASVTTSAVVEILNPTTADGLHVESPTQLADTAVGINSRLTSYGAQLLALIMGAGLLLTAAVVLADVVIRRHDLGRRRTLGITRLDLIILVTGRVVLAALIGALLGSGLTWSALATRSAAPPSGFIAAVAILAILAAVAAAIPPAWYAAHRDPVAVMRTP